MTRNEKIAKKLFDADKNMKPIEQITKEYEGLSLDDAYEIQMINVKKKVEEGSVITGKKIGLTSKAMQESLGVDTPDFGILYDTMEIENNFVKKSDILQTRVEGELAFILKEDLKENATVEDV